MLVTGATGYIGGRLARRLLEAGYRVRCLARDRRKLASRPWSTEAGVEIVEGDVGDAAALERALAGCFAGFYLVHSMGVVGRSFAAQDRELAERFAAAAERAGVERIVYLGGLGETGEGLSEHLASRREVEAALKTSRVPVTVLRAAMIIGAGSASFEILRYLVERLPVMVTPRWVRTESQPIDVRNVLHYLVACLAEPRTASRTLEIGGPDVVRYELLIQLLARRLGLPRRRIVPVPVLTPRLSSLWIHLVTPIDSSIARPLAEGLRNRVVCASDEAQRLLPQKLHSVKAALRDAVESTRAGRVETDWSDAGVLPGDPAWAGGTLFEDRRADTVAASPQAVFDAVCRVGGGHGYYAADWLWRLRGAMDRLVGGPGLRRGRREPERVYPGDALDFWRVIRVREPEHLELVAEMRLPGEASLRFDVERAADGASRLVQTARFRPRGLAGLLYWYAVVPLHGIVFRGMFEGIRRAAVAAEGAH